MHPESIINIAWRKRNSALVWNVAMSGLRAGNVVLLLPLILKTIPTAEMGLWYVFGSIGAVAGLLDAGFGPVMGRSAGYLWAGATELKPWGIEPQNAVSRRPNFTSLTDLLVTMRWFYRWLGLAVLVLAGLAGGYFVWRLTRPLDQAASLRAAYGFYVLTLAFNLSGSFWPNVLSGINAMKEYYQVWVMSLVLSYGAVLAGLWGGAGFWSLVMGNFALAVGLRMGGLRMFWLRAGPEMPALRGGARLDMLRVMWPNAWRTGLVSIGSYLSIQANTLIGSEMLPLPEVAAYGLTQQVFLFLVTVSSAWFMVKTPEFNQLRVRGDDAGIFRLVVGCLRRSLLTFLVLAGLCCGLGPRLMSGIGTQTGLLSQPLLLGSALIWLLDMHHHCFAYVIYSRNENPFVRPTLLTGAANVVLALWLVPRFGVAGLIWSQGLAVGAYINWWAVWRGLKTLNRTPRDYVAALFGREGRHV